MFKLIIFTCLLAASVQSKSVQNPAVPYYPQPYSAYPQAYPQVYPQVYPAQPKYNVQPVAYVAPTPYSPGYRQFFMPANPAYNPYYYASYPAYPQPYPYPYAPTNDGTQAPASEVQPGWGEYLSSIWNYVPNFPTYGSSEGQQTSEAENGSPSGAETPSSGEANSVKGDKPTEEQKVEQKPADSEQPEQAPSKQFAPASPFAFFGQPQFYGQLPYQQAAYDPSKLNVAKNGAVSSFLFYRNQPQVAFQQSQPFIGQKYYKAPASLPNQGTAAVAYQKYLQYQNQFQQPQQDQPFQQQQQEQNQQFQQQQHQQFQSQQYDQQPQQEDSSVVVDSNATGVQVNTEAQQQAQSKLATGSN